MMKHWDLAIVGAGVMGLAHAVHASRAGLSVVVFERSPKALGASVQNFGMLALIAQAAGRQLADARRALADWQEIADQAGIEMAPSGCLFLAREPEEMSVLEEFCHAASMSGHRANLVKQDDLCRYAADLRSKNLLGGLWSPDAWKVDQRQATAKIADWLQRAHNVSVHFSAEAQAVDLPYIETSIGTFKTDHVIICGGDEFDRLFPDSFQATGVTTCKLQMLRTHPQPDGWRLQPFVLGGLSLPRYSAFASCPSLPDLKKLQKRKQRAQLAHGIHVIACQEADGSVTIGDSHSYGDKLSQERSEDIDRLILDDLAAMISLPNPKIAERWLGRYAHLPGNEALRLSPANGVTVVTMTNGQGMTHAFALAADVIGHLM